VTIFSWVTWLVGLVTRGLAWLWNGLKSHPNIVQIGLGLYFVGVALGDELMGGTTHTAVVLLCLVGLVGQAHIFLMRGENDSLKQVVDIMGRNHRDAIKTLHERVEKEERKTAWLEFENTRQVNERVRLQKAYDALLGARTDEVILEIRSRLVRDEPVKYVLPDVPAAPTPPYDVEAPF
jgi:hypothetical protein